MFLIARDLLLMDKSAMVTFQNVLLANEREQSVLMERRPVLKGASPERKSRCSFPSMVEVSLY